MLLWSIHISVHDDKGDFLGWPHPSIHTEAHTICAGLQLVSRAVIILGLHFSQEN
jgi:hypothetical protein